MDIKELRIGNLVEILGEERVVETISNMPSRGEMYWVGTKGLMDVKMIHVKPIEITEKRLLDWGATRHDHRAFPSYNLNGIQINFINGKWSDYVHDIELTGIHQLQNLHFAIRGTEL